MTFINVATVHETEWSKPAAIRAEETGRMTELVGRLLNDLAHLDATRQPKFDYLEPAALDAVRSDPDTFSVVGRLAGHFDGTSENCVAAAYWPEADLDPVDVELEFSADAVAWGPVLLPVPAAKLRHHLIASVDARRGRIETLELS